MKAFIDLEENYGLRPEVKNIKVSHKFTNDFKGEQRLDETCIYSEDGYLIERIKNTITRNIKTTYTYDCDNKLIETHSNGFIDIITKYKYDDEGRLLQTDAIAEVGAETTERYEYLDETTVKLNGLEVELVSSKSHNVCIITTDSEKKLIVRDNSIGRIVYIYRVSTIETSTLLANKLSIIERNYNNKGICTSNKYTAYNRGEVLTDSVLYAYDDNGNILSYVDNIDNSKSVYKYKKDAESESMSIYVNGILSDTTIKYYDRDTHALIMVEYISSIYDKDISNVEKYEYEYYE